MSDVSSEELSELQLAMVEQGVMALKLMPGMRSDVAADAAKGDKISIEVLKRFDAEKNEPLDPQAQFLADYIRLMGQ